MQCAQHPAALQFGSVCSGIEAVSLAWNPLGITAAWFSEIEPFPCAVLAHHHPDVSNLGDMTHIADKVRDGHVVAPDILVGGTPCQSFSVAGSRGGISDPRGALTLKYVELANVIDQTRQKQHQAPATVVWENVPGVLSDRSNAFGQFLGALAGESRALESPGRKWTNAGYVSGPQRRIAWRVLDAQYFGVAQRRKRVFLVASGRDDINPAEILFESGGLRGDFAQGVAPWQNSACIAGSGAASSGGYGRLSPPYDKSKVTIGFGVQSVAGAISHTLNTSTGSSEDGTGRGVPVITTFAPGIMAFAENSRGEVRWEAGHGQITGVVSTGGGKPGQGQPVVLSVALRGRDRGVSLELGGELATALRASSGGSDKNHVLSADPDAWLHYTPHESDARDWSSWRVRRLMPVECERLQGMPDDYTLVPYRAKLAADTPRYKAIGNSMAVPCVAWLGQRLLRFLHKG